jgi:hypothetical protein
MEADLGIDTVKQAETFAAIRETFSDSGARGIEPARLPDAGPPWWAIVRKNRPDLASGSGERRKLPAVAE